MVPVKKAAAPVAKKAAKAVVVPVKKAAAPVAKKAAVAPTIKVVEQVKPAIVLLKRVKKVAEVPQRPKMAPEDLKGEKKKFLEALLELRANLSDQVRNISASNQNTTKQAGEELADIGSDNFYREIGLSMMTEDGKKLAAIHEAVNRLLCGTYGTCADCGCKIAEGRLKAIPYAKLCINCQEEMEKQALLPELGIGDEEEDAGFGKGNDEDANSESADDEDEEEDEE